MSGTTSTTGPEGPEPGTGPGPERGPVTVAEAARVLGISERAVRKRITAGTLRASPVGRSYDVWLPALHGPGPEQGRPTSGPGPEPIEAQYRSSSGAVVSDAARLQLAAIRDEWLTPLVERIGALERENGDLAGQLAARADVLAAKDETIAELRRRAEVAEAELERARLRLAEVSVPAVVVVAGQDAPEVPHATGTTPHPHRGVHGLWRRLRRAWRRG